MGELTGGRVSYYLAKVEHPQRADQAPYRAECEDIIAALKMDFNQACEFKAIWRTASAALGNAKQGHKAMYDAQKRVHYATRSLIELQHKEDAEVEPEPDAPVEEEIPYGSRDGESMGGGWIRHAKDHMPECFDGDELVDVKMEGGIEYSGNYAKLAKDWVWVNDGTHSTIAGWRLTKIELATASELDEWKPLTTTHIPDGLDPDEMVEVQTDSSRICIGARRADQWDWEYRNYHNPGSAPHISHWRRYRHGA